METPTNPKSETKRKSDLLHFRLANFRNGKPAEIEFSIGWGMAAVIILLIQVAAKMFPGVR